MNEQPTQHSSQYSAQGRRKLLVALILVLVCVAGVYAWDEIQKARRNRAAARLSGFADELKTRAEVHALVFGNAQPDEISPLGGLTFKERWSYRSLFWTYVLDVSYTPPNPGDSDAKILAESYYYENRRQKILYLTGDEGLRIEED